MKDKGRYGQFIGWIYTAIDFIVLNVVFIAVWFFSQDSLQSLARQAWLLLNISFLIEVYLLTGIHDNRVVYADRVVIEAVKWTALHSVLFLSLTSFLRIDLPWDLLGYFYASFFIALSVWWLVSRKVLKWYRTRGFNYRRIIIIGGGTVGIRLMDELESDQGYGYRVVAFFDNNPKARSVKAYKGSLNDVEAFVRSNLVDEMYCTIPDEDTGEVERLIRIAESNAIDFYYVPQFSRRVTRRFELNSIGNVPILAIRPYPLSNMVNRFTKRAFDVVVSSVAMILSPIVLIPVAIAIRLSSPGPVFFKQERTGYRGKAFMCYKFRTMKANDRSDTDQATKGDPRVTRVGNFLRRTSIDELPQFYNVFRGDMSIVGPRPHMIHHTEAYSALIDKYMIRHTIKPGITGWAQVNGYRGITDQLWKMEKRVEYDVWYAENWNFLLDIKIIFLTVFNIFRGEKNAF